MAVSILGMAALWPLCSSSSTFRVLSLQFSFLSFFRYFETFDVVSEISAADRLLYLSTVSQCSSPEELRKIIFVDELMFGDYLRGCPSSFLFGQETCERN